jgi:hypothetical protein
MNARAIAICAAASLAAVVAGIAPIVFVSVTRGNLSSLAFGASIAVFAAGCLLGVASWLSGLARTARTTDWDWFVAVLALGPVGALAYGLRRAD